MLAYALYLGCETAAAILKENMMTAKPETLIRPALVTALILLIPFVAMQLSGEVNWTLSDFLVMGTLLFGTGLVYELLAKRLTSLRQRLAFGTVLLAGMLYVWVELAVGVFTTLGS